MATDGGAIKGEPDVDPTSKEADKSGWGLTAGRFRGTVGLRSEGTYDVVIEQFGQVELDRQS